MIRSWRFWVLFVLLVGPVVAYVGFGALWLTRKGWIFYAFSIWVTAGVIFGYLLVRWTKGREAVLPPIDWDSPRTFTPLDRHAWTLVEAEAELGDGLAMDALSELDTYVNTGKRLSLRLAAHYHPLSNDAIEHVPVVHILTALELAAEDLSNLCREIPGGDMVTPAHWKKAVQAAGFFSKANEIYGYLLPLFQPATGLVRLGTQKLMVQPAWKNMQQNVLRWFYRAYVNRLGIHLIELYSGRLAIGAEHYRKLTRKRGVHATTDISPPTLDIAVVGARGSGRSSLIAALDRARHKDLSAVRGRLEADGFDESLADLLMTAEWVKAPDYTIHPDAETARDRATRRDVLKHVVRADLVLMTIDARRENLGPDLKFLEDWSAYFAKNSSSEAPPLVVVLTEADRLVEPGSNGHNMDSLVRAKVEAVRKRMPASVVEVIPVGLGTDPPTGISDRLLLTLAPLLERSEKIAVIRHMQDYTARSKARRLFGQIGTQGKRLFQSIRSVRKTPPS
ncbi:MAG: putative GTPase [Planctomycetota bacterium]|nr:putative GTPase [Planctomycetota bacterium]